MAEMHEARSHRTQPTPFLAKIYKLVENPDNQDLISWNENGSSFIVKDAIVFARDLLPKHFKHNTFASFLRQLSNYGFKKLVSNFHEWQHDKFKRGEKHLLVEIKPRKLSRAGPVVSNVEAPTFANTGEDQVIISSIPPQRNTPVNAISDQEEVREIKRLRKENAALKQEVHKLKIKLQNVVDLEENLVDEPVSVVPIESGGNGNAEKNAPIHMKLDLNNTMVGEPVDATRIEIDLNRVWEGEPVDASCGSDASAVGWLDLHL